MALVGGGLMFSCISCPIKEEARLELGQERVEEFKE